MYDLSSILLYLVNNLFTVLEKNLTQSLKVTAEYCSCIHVEGLQENMKTHQLDSQCLKSSDSSQMSVSRSTNVIYWVRLSIVTHCYKDARSKCLSCLDVLQPGFSIHHTNLKSHELKNVICEYHLNSGQQIMFRFANQTKISAQQTFFHKTNHAYRQWCTCSAPPSQPFFHCKLEQDLQDI
jgi:hypothetical protein